MVPFKLGYSLHEAGSHFARNLSTSLGAVVTIFLSLFIIGLFAILSSMISNVVGDVESRNTIQAFLADEADQTTVDTLQADIGTWEGVESVTYKSKDEALAEYRETMENTVEPQLAAIREELSMPLENGGVLHAELYEQPSATRAVIVLHGYTESGEKFREMTWYFLQSGFNVYAIDHRGHGRSARAVDETWLTHVDHFSDYVRDLEAFMDRVVLPRAQNLPL